jgi:lipoprotein-releasing system permease protein
MIEFFIAKKHIIERKRQSFIAILGIMIGVTVLIVSIGIANGLDKNMIDNILSMTSHINVTNTDYSLQNYKELQKEIEGINGVKGAVPKLSTQGILKYNGAGGTYVSGIKIEGMDFEDAKRVMGLDTKIVQGSMDVKKPTQFLMGKELFDQLGASIGESISIVSADNRELYLEIAGVFQSGYYEFDTSLIIVPLKAVQIMSYVGDTTSYIDVMLNKVYDAPKIADLITSKTGLIARTWGEMNRNLLAALSLEKTVMILVFSLIVVIAGFVVGVILNMLVREKTRDIGIMRSMGFSSKSIMNIFLIEGFTLGIIGNVLGIFLSFIIIWYIKNFSISQLTSIYYLSKIPVEITYKEVVVIVAANLIVIFLSSIFPAYRAAKLKPVEALKYE